MKITGHTRLGREINRHKNKTDDARSLKTRISYGILEKSHKESYNFYVRIIDKNGEIGKKVGPLPLIESPEDLAQRFGSPKDMESNFMVRITYVGPFIERGVCQIMKNLTNAYPGADAEEAAKANELPVKGTAFAPPGAGTF